MHAFRFAACLSLSLSVSLYLSIYLSISVSLWLTWTVHTRGREHHWVRHGGINAGWVSVVSSCRRLRERKRGNGVVHAVYVTACSSGVEPRVRNARWRDKLIARMLALFDLMDCSNDLARRGVIRSFLTIFLSFFLFFFLSFLLPVFIPFRLLIWGRC